jgi:hypothetical protein
MRVADIQAPQPRSEFSEPSGVTAIAANDVWAYGGANSNPPLQIQHFDGTSWSLVPAPALPNSAGLNGMRAVSSNNIWAVGYQQPGSQDLPLIVHWDGASWNVVSNPAGNCER